MKEKIKAFIALAERAVTIRDVDIDDWRMKYDLIFSEEISGAIAATGFSLDYYDPDTSYEEDVRAYVDAVERKANHLRKVVDGFKTIEESF